MTDQMFLIMMITAMVGLVAIASVMLVREIRVHNIDARIAKVVSGDIKTSRFNGLSGLLQRIGVLSRRFYSLNQLDHLRVVISAAGFNVHRMMPMLLGLKVAAMVLVPLLSFVVAAVVGAAFVKVIIVCVGLGIGIGAPEMILSLIRRKFVTAIQRGTPDALDLLVVCSESGMGLESALGRVSAEMKHSNPPMATVLAQLLDDLRILPNRRDAFDKLGRFNVNGLRRFGTMLSQSMNYGTPIGNALRSVAEELRRERVNQLEEKAVKLPAKLIFPLILFILPSLWIILLGSSLLHLADSMKSAAGMIH